MGEHEETNVQQQTHAEPTNEERPKRIKKKHSHYFASPYADPCRRRRHCRDKVLVYNPLREVPKEKKEAFNKYIGSTDETLIRCELAEQSKKLFT